LSSSCFVLCFSFCDYKTLPMVIGRAKSTFLTRFGLFHLLKGEYESLQHQGKLIIML
jgi:hypothetical protein